MIPAFVEAYRSEHRVSRVDEMKSWLNLPPTIRSVQTTIETMRSAMVKADTIIGPKQFDFLVRKHTKNQDEEDGLYWHYKQVTRDCYSERMRARGEI